MSKLKTVLITGATGLIGGDILRYFRSINWKVIMATSTKNVVSMDKGIRIIPFNLSDIADNFLFDANFEQIDAVIHAAALISKGHKWGHHNERQAFLDNIAGTFKLIEQSVKCKVKQFIYISGTNIYEQLDQEMLETSTPKPANYYLLSKWFGEEIANFFERQDSTKLCNLRISAPYGPGYRNKSVIPILVERALNGENLELWGTGSREQVFTYVRDISRACKMVIEKEISGTFNITGPGPVSMFDLATTILQVIKNTGSKIIFKEKQDPNEGMRRRISIEAAKTVFNYMPLFDVSAGIADMISIIIEKPQPLYYIDHICDAIENEYKIVQNPVYGYQSLDPIPSEDEIRDYYKKEYYDLIQKGGRFPESRRLMCGGQIADRESEWLNATLHADVSAILNDLHCGINIFDIGCGTGELIYYLSENGFNPIGIEPSADAIRIARSRGLVVYDVPLEEFISNRQNVRENLFDVVLLMNVLEHVRKPFELINQVKALLAPGGFVFVRVPNDFSELQLAAQKKMNKKPWWITIPDHIYYFNFDSLFAFLKGAGFEIVYSQGDFPMELFLMMGKDYVNNPTVGNSCHQERILFEMALPGEMRRRIYQSLGAQGIGRTCLVVGKLINK